MSEVHDAWLKEALGIDVHAAAAGVAELSAAQDGDAQSAAIDPVQPERDEPDAPDAPPVRPSLPAKSASMPTLKQGASGPAVEDLQNLLNKNGASLKADGQFGSGTTAAVKDFQSRNGLDVDGVVGRKTWEALSKGQAPQPKPDPKPDPRPDPRPDHELRKAVIIVTDGSSNDAIAKATVRLGGQEETTGNTGQATFSVPSAKYSYVVTADGYQQATGSVAVGAAEETEAHIEMTLAGGKTWSVSFAAVDEKTQEPVAGANVRIGEQSATTDRSGESTLKMAAGSYPYRLRAAGYETTSGNIEVAADEDTHHVELLKPAQASGSALFSVLDENTAKGIEGAKIEIDTNSLETGTAGLGVFVLPPGSYVYKVTAKGYKQASAQLTIADDEDANVVELMVPDNSATGSVFFTVADENTSKGIEGATIQIGKSSSETGNIGVAVFFMPAGHYDYRVSANGYQDAQGSLDVEAGSDTQMVELLKPSGATAGLVVSVSDKATRQPIDGATVQIDKESSSTVPGSRGIVTFIGLKAGKHPYRVGAKGYAEARGTIEVADDDSTPPLHVFLTLLRPAPTAKKGKLSVQVSFSDDGQGVANAAVSVDPPATPPAKSAVPTDASGRADFEGLTPGKCTVTARAPQGSGNAIVTITADTIELANITIPRAKPSPKAGANKKCFAPNAIPDFHPAPDGEPLPTQRTLIPMKVLAKCDQVCVTSILTKTGIYQVLTEGWIPKTILDDLGLGPLDLAPIPIPIAVIVSLLTASNTQSELHGVAKSASGKPVSYTLLYELR